MQSQEVKTTSVSSRDDDDDDHRNDGCSHLRVVLLCKGRGGDKASYRPNADESQWWGRRDALVRCVASFLFGPRDGGGGTNGGPPREDSRDLVLLFDEDLARIHMTTVRDGDDDNRRRHSHSRSAAEPVPTEQAIIHVWKRAARQLGQPVTGSGIQCTAFLDPADAGMVAACSSSASSPKNSQRGKNDAPPKGSNLPAGMDTKRQVLEYLQQRCSIDFLRQQGLNSTSEVILRKRNRNDLVQVWHRWGQQQAEHQGGHHRGGTSSSPADVGRQRGRLDKRLSSIYRELLLQRPSQVPADARTVAGTLHETGQEFPCFRGTNGSESNATASSPGDTSDRCLHACLFLGAVRDMTSHENKLLEGVCRDCTVPLVAMRFGTVPEFTSKILSLLAFHHSNRAVRPAIRRLVESGEAARPATNLPDDSTKEQPTPIVTSLTVVCTVPTLSRNISIELGKRDRLHWSLVRIIVCSLWRSKLVSAGSNQNALPIHHTNSLCLIFDDGIVVRLDESAFVNRLASQHQAAPSEHQILTGLIQEIDSVVEQMASNTDTGAVERSGGGSKKKVARRVIQETVQASAIAVTCTIGLQHHAANEVTSRFYALDSPHGSRDCGVLLILEVDSEDGKCESQQLKVKPSKMYRELLSASRTLGISTIEQAIVGDTCQDKEAASIIALQHFCYQNRVFGRDGCTSNLTTQTICGSKRKRPKG